MAALKLLLDTNIFIALEDPGNVPPSVALLAQKSHLHGLSLFVDEACTKDLERDPNERRRNSSLSRLTKFPVLDGIAHRPDGDLLNKFGAINSPNDRCDVLMLDTVDLGVVDFLVSEDIGLHKRARNAGLGERVFTVREMLAWLQRAFEPREFKLPFIETRKAHQIDLADPIFISLREDYGRFDDWFAKCRSEHRNCWVVQIDGQLAGLVILKDETRQSTKPNISTDRVLKVCTFKMKAEYQGEKFGEQLLKKILWYAQSNSYSYVYLTAFPKHEFLFSLLKLFGFAATETLPNGELRIEKRLIPEAIGIALENESPLARDLQVYPRFYDGSAVSKFVMPIQGQFHTMLFPEIAEGPSLPLFPNIPTNLHSIRGDRTPGNTIRKVYVCRSPTRTLRTGDVLLFYLSKYPSLVRSQTITTIGIVEDAQLAETIGELQRLVGRRSVYPNKDLEAWDPNPASPVLVIDFLLIGHFQPSIEVERLTQLGVFANRPPQSIKQLAEAAYSAFSKVCKVQYG
jgi:hypothetical protein